jgi:FkbM family methyltransferase
MDSLSKLIYRARPPLLAVFLKGLLRIQRKVVVTKSGLRFWVDPASHLGREILDTGTYEPLTMELIEALLRPGDSFVDVGANEGVFSVLASRCVGRGGRVLSIEPQSRLTEVLQRNFRENGCDNIQLEQVALSDSEGKSVMSLSASTNTGASSFLVAPRFAAKDKVVTRTLDQVLQTRELHRARLAKIDCEGAEAKVIEGALKALKKQFFQFLLIEFHPRLTGPLAPQKIDRALRDCGYELSQVRTGHWLYHLPKLPEVEGSLGPSHPVPSEAFET